LQGTRSNKYDKQKGHTHTSRGKKKETQNAAHKERRETAQKYEDKEERGTRNEKNAKKTAQV